MALKIWWAFGIYLRKEKERDTMKILRTSMRKYEAEKMVSELNNQAKSWKQKRAQRTPKFTEWRQRIPEECLTNHFMAFAAQTSKSGLELKNAFSMYSKLMIVAPAFVEQYIKEGAQIERPMTGEWNLRALIEAHYGISESVYRIIEQEKPTDPQGTTRSGFEALQAMFVKGCVLGGTSDHADYVVDGIKYENKGEAGRVCGQEKIFSADGYKAACDRCASKYHKPSFDKALRKAFHQGTAVSEVIKILRGIYPDAPEAIYQECGAVYLGCLSTIPEAVECEAYKKVCTRRESKYMNAQYEVREYIARDEICTRDREKEVFRFVAGLFELKIYQERAQFDVLDLCENQTGRILSFDCRNMNITDMANKMWGKVRFYNSIGGDNRSNAHQIGFNY